MSQSEGMPTGEYYDQDDHQRNVYYFDYDRTAFVSACNDFVHFLTTLYVPTSSVIRPPPEGWPELTPELLKPARKTEEVIDLVRHLPFLAREKISEGHEIAPETKLADFRSPYVRDVLQEGDGGRVRVMTEGPYHVPRHVLGLCWNSNGTNPLLDTKSGVVYWPEAPPGIEQTTLSQQEYEYEDDEDEGEWDPDEGAEDGDTGADKQVRHDDDTLEWFRDAPAWPADDFFRVLKYLFRSGRYLVKWNGDVIDAENTSESDELLQELRKVYTEHGWPGEGYRKIECKAAVDALEERFG